MRQRLDTEMVRRGICISRQEAQRLIDEKQVLVDGAIADKPARKVAPAQNILLAGPKPKYVSRAGLKLEGALKAFGLDPDGLQCLDAGSSTGGFTDCLLQLGAKEVIAVDVGTNQLHEKIKQDARVDVFEQTDIRKFVLEGDRVDLVVCDLSFISLKLVLGNLKSFVKPNGCLIVLVKPQFEAGKKEVDKTQGVITDPEIWRRVLNEVFDSAISFGLRPQKVVRSSVKGTNGNQEFVLLLAPMKSDKNNVEQVDTDILINSLFS